MSNENHFIKVLFDARRTVKIFGEIFFTFRKSKQKTLVGGFVGGPKKSWAGAGGEHFYLYERKIMLSYDFLYDFSYK